ncbi:MAG: hypothetical protein ACI8RZ_003813 [Myxococcota bacterium]
MPPLLPRHQLWSIKKSARSVEVADQTGAADEGTLRFALADGTSASPQARAWSQILARHACRMGVPRDKGDLIRWLSGAHESWKERFQRSTKLWTQPDLPELGAAALCLIELAETDSGFRWTALLQGDVCLFQIRDGQTIRRLPMEHSQDFGRSKPCFFSEPIALNHQPVQFTASGSTGDILVMASEPLARWIYAQLELGADPWQELLNLPDDNAFAGLVNRERAADRMPDDDTALMFIHTDAIEDASILDAPVRAPVIPPIRPPRPPELDAPQAASDFEDIFDLELIAEPPSPDEATELSLPSPLDAPDYRGDRADALNEVMLTEDPFTEDPLIEDDFSDEVRPPIHILPTASSEQPDDIALDLPLDGDFSIDSVSLDRLSLDRLSLDSVSLDTSFPLDTPLQPLDLDDEPPYREPAPTEEYLFGDELDLFADNESIPRPRPTLLASDPGSPLAQSGSRLSADEIPSDVFASVVGQRFAAESEDEFDILEALDDMPDSEDEDEFEEAQEMSFYSPVPTVDHRQALPLPPPPPPARTDYRPYVVAALALLILILLVANAMSLSSRVSTSPLVARIALRVDHLESSLSAIESQLTAVQHDAAQGDKREAGALGGLTTRVSTLEARHEPAGELPIPEGKVTPEPVAVAAAPVREKPAAVREKPAAAVAAVRKKKPVAVAAPAKKKPAVIAATSPSQIPASAPDAAWIGCPRQVCSRSGSRVTIRSVTPVWASPYSGDRVAVLGAGTYPLLSEEDVGGYLWVKVQLK